MNYRVQFCYEIIRFSLKYVRTYVIHLLETYVTTLCN